MATIKILMTLWHYGPTYDEAPPSRFLHIFLHLRRFYPDTYLLTKQERSDSSIPNQVITIKPKVAIKGKYTLLKGMLFRLQMLSYTVRLVLRERYHCVFLRGYEFIILIPFLKLAGIRIIYDFHGYWGQELLHSERRSRGIFNKYAERIMLHFSDRILIVSHGILNQIRKYEKKCLFLPNGVDINAIRTHRNETVPTTFKGKFVVGFIGNWEGSMKIEDICEAVRYLRDTVAVIVGWGNNADRLIERYSTIPNILFTGRVSLERAYTLLNLFDVCIIPYNSEATHASYPDYFSTRKGKEYLAAGKPIIVADVIGKEAWLENGKTCLYYTSGDSSDLAEKIRMLQNDQELSAKIRSNNYRLSESFSWERVISQSGIINTIDGMK